MAGYRQLAKIPALVKMVRSDQMANAGKLLGGLLVITALLTVWLVRRRRVRERGLQSFHP